jgi:hypothetical protein
MNSDTSVGGNDQMNALIILTIVSIYILFAAGATWANAGERYPTLKGLFWPLIPVYFLVKEVMQLTGELEGMVKEWKKRNRKRT